ncbi:helix-turn-helix transcriptional regulator [Spiractinospora alimapuensis]|uniref:helix-turn-helix transcriptional regulator n=1 Tax=Spiractinospora alimapuensis TaxID=2820884 RepID=UPI001F198B6C|nr:helix-turn-helix transcriptional regulator [Spiractinospora alimapuensis]QVQ51330.1 helix-turn-helix transcriptional regulator [Spiractinospora alimapuensis]
MPKTPTAAVNGTAIREFRHLLGMSTSELADRARTTSQHVSNIELETRACSAVLAGRIADALGVRRAAILRMPINAEEVAA